MVTPRAWHARQVNLNRWKFGFCADLRDSCVL
jgi:hypothetical protein